MTDLAKKLFLSLGILTAMICACLGLETQRANHLGWALLFAGTTFTAVGCVTLSAVPTAAEDARQPGDRSLWLPCLGALMIGLVTPLEYLFLPQVLPRSDLAQDTGLILSASGLAFYLLSLRSPNPWQAARSFSTTLRIFLCPISAGLLFFVLGLGIGYSSLIGLAIIFLLVLPGLAYRMKVV